MRFLVFCIVTILWNNLSVLAAEKALNAEALMFWLDVDNNRFLYRGLITLSITTTKNVSTVSVTDVRGLQDGVQYTLAVHELAPHKHCALGDLGQVLMQSTTVLQHRNQTESGTTIELKKTPEMNIWHNGSNLHGRSVVITYKMLGVSDPSIHSCGSLGIVNYDCTLKKQCQNSAHIVTTDLVILLVSMVFWWHF